jgi:hypothetical protein
MPATLGQKLRLNVVALISEVTVGKLLVCIDEQSLVEDLASKVRNALAKSNIEGCLLRLTNRQGYNLQGDDKVGDVLIDAEEVIAVLTSQPEDPATRRQLAGGVGELMSFVRSDMGGGGRKDDSVPYPFSGGEEPLPLAPADTGARSECIPGPAEVFEEDLLEQPVDVQRLPSGSDWTVGGLTPKLREYISTRFREVNASASEPGQSFISVTMCPRARAGTVAREPVRYSIARIDIIEFERLCTQKIAETRSRVDYFSRCQKALQLLLEKGASDAEYAPNLLPYRYRNGEKFSGLLAEADMPSFGQVEGFRPTIVIDTAGAVGESLELIRSALKRMLYSFLVVKSKFNLLKFSPQGKPMTWANGMVPPATQVLREAEEFLDGLRPLRGNQPASLLDALKLAMSDPEADSVFVLTSGLPRRCGLPMALAALREANIRALPLHIIGVECDSRAELDLRKLAEDNHGSFRHKRFATGGSGPDMASTLSEGTDFREKGDERLTISAQLSISEIMIDEQERHTVDWLEEQKCANRLLFSSASQQPVPSADQVYNRFLQSRLDESNQEHGRGKSGLQELFDSAAGLSNLQTSNPKTVPHAAVPPGYPPAVATAFLGPGAERRRVAERMEKSQQRAISQPRSLVESLRRPSVVNPWDCPGDPAHASKLFERQRLGGGGPLPRSVGMRPTSASRATSAKRRL